MKKTNNTYIDKLVARVINETLEERADSLVSKIKTNVNELGGMDDGHPRFGKLNLSKMSDDEIADLMKQPMNTDDYDDEDDVLDYEEHVMNKTWEDGNDEYDEFEDEELWGDIDEDDCMECGQSNMYEGTEGSEVCECGGGISEGECMECGKSYMEEGIYDEDDLDDDNEFDYVAEEDDTLEFEDDETEKEEENKEACNYHSKKIKSGDLTPEETQDFKSRMEKMGCKSAVKDLARRPISMNERLRGNQSKIDKNKNGKIDSEDFKMLRKNDKPKGSVKLSESEIIDLIEKIVLEQKEETKSNIKTTEKPKGLAAYEKAVKGSKRENDEYIKSVGKKMKEYLKDGSKGEYEENPKHFPKGNGELAKMKKKAYEISKDGDGFLDDYMRPGMENLDYDEMHPNEDWMKDNIEGSSRTGNNPEWGNAEETDLGAKLNKKRKDNKFAKARRMSANKAPQPVVSDKPGQESGKGLHIKVESIESKTDKKLNEEFEKMKSLISYDRKTQ
jgi:hypothetical protein